MMKYVCDRCGKDIPNGKPFVVVYGLLGGAVGTKESSDLCGDCYNECVDFIKDSNKTVAKAPDNMREMHGGEIWGDCPVCKRVVRFAQRHCHNCTQLLDWQSVLEKYPAEVENDEE